MDEVGKDCQRAGFARDRIRITDRVGTSAVNGLLRADVWRPWMICIAVLCAYRLGSRLRIEPPARGSPGHTRRPPARQACGFSVA